VGTRAACSVHYLRRALPTIANGVRRTTHPGKVRPRLPPPRVCGSLERAQSLGICTETLRDRSPAAVYATLLEKASSLFESAAMYPLARQKQSARRRDPLTHPPTKALTSGHRTQSASGVGTSPTQLLWPASGPTFILLILAVSAATGSPAGWCHARNRWNCPSGLIGGEVRETKDPALTTHACLPIASRNVPSRWPS